VLSFSNVPLIKQGIKRVVRWFRDDQADQRPAEQEVQSEM